MSHGRIDILRSMIRGECVVHLEREAPVSRSKESMDSTANHPSFQTGSYLLGPSTLPQSRSVTSTVAPLERRGGGNVTPYLERFSSHRCIISTIDSRRNTNRKQHGLTPKQTSESAFLSTNIPATSQLVGGCVQTCVGVGVGVGVYR